MIEGKWNISASSYKAWRKQNPSVERLILTGEVSVDHVVSKFKEVDVCQYKEIYLEDFVFLDGVGEEWSLDNILQDWDNSIPGIFKIVMNREVSTRFVMESSFVYTADHKCLVHVPDNLTSLHVPHGVERIGAYACYCCEKIAQITLPDGLIAIDNGAFCQADGFLSCEIPDTVTALGEHAFAMTNMEKIKLSNRLEVIPYACFELAWLEELNIPSSVRTICSHAFHGCCFTDVVVPEGVESIGYNAFEACSRISLPSTLKDIAPDFYFEECVDDPSYRPVLTISPDNPVYYLKKGKLYFKENDEPAMGEYAMRKMIDNKTYHW